MLTISQYYSTRNNQPDKSNGLSGNFDGNSNLILASIKVGYSYEIIKQPISLILQLIHFTTELFGLLMTAKFNFTSK